jgi:hypothetical protein
MSVRRTRCLCYRPAYRCCGCAPRLLVSQAACGAARSSGRGCARPAQPQLLARQLACSCGTAGAPGGSGRKGRCASQPSQPVAGAPGSWQRTGLVSQARGQRQFRAIQEGSEAARPCDHIAEAVEGRGSRAKSVHSASHRAQSRPIVRTLVLFALPRRGWRGRHARPHRAHGTRAGARTYASRRRAIGVVVVADVDDDIAGRGMLSVSWWGSAEAGRARQPIQQEQLRYASGHRNGSAQAL